MIPSTAIQFAIITAIDIIIVVLLIYILMRSGSKKEKAFSDEYVRKLEGSLKKTMSDSARATDKMFRAFDEKIASINQAADRAEEKHSSLCDAIKNADNVLKKAAPAYRAGSVSTEDPYACAADLINRGYSADHVQRESGLSRGEIELIRQISRHKSQ